MFDSQLVPCGRITCVPTWRSTDETYFFYIYGNSKLFGFTPRQGA